MSAELHRRLENLIRFGTIKAIYPAKPFTTVTVTIGAITTAKLRFVSLRAGKTKTWDPPTIGEEVVVFSPSGVLEMGIAVAGLNNEDNPSPSDDLNKTIRIFEDGCLLSYDTKTHHLDAVLPEGGTCNVTADVQITGKLHVTETITAGDNISTVADVLAGDISLTNHRTSGVKAGSEESGGPIP
ncbi:phage baseplate assembly protein V [Acinetobacter schindleri]|uniref:phage baseplate assembly protein V n=1 Tax=Acinetobacter schindleri TaxID=108981 RepID=UPI00209A773C|nr:phage baseplate assembly protein V [Acinetobacter schindleri]MCO8066810.1 phage baseplate assembly protein V [Acinetobacter schindleri]